jgi:PAS domain S-box-containing protein
VKRKTAASLAVQDFDRVRVEQMSRATIVSPGPSVLYDADGICRAASPAWELAAGWPDGSALGKHFDELVPRLEPHVAEIHAQVFDGKALLNEREERYVSQDGEVRWIQCEYRPFGSLEGKIIGYVVHGRDVTSLVAARRDAQSNAERLTMALEAARAGVFEIDYEASSFWCSPEFEALVGGRMTFEEACASPWPMVHPDDVEHVREAVATAPDSAGRPAALETRIRLASGEVRWIQVQIKLSRLEDGSLAKLTGLVVDIDARKRQELAMSWMRREAHESAERLALALEAAHAGVFETDFKNRTFWCSPELTEILGRTLTWAEASQKVWPVVHADDREAMELAIDASYETRNIEPHEARVVRADGEVRWIDLRAVIHLDASGEISKCVGVMLDIDARKRQELALIEARREAQENADRLKVALNAGQAGVFETNFQTRNFWCSPEFVEIVQQELTFEEASRVWPSIHPEDVARVQAAIDDSHGKHDEARCEWRVRLPSGGYRWIEARAQPIHDQEGRFEKLVGVVLDIDARKRQELALAETRQEAQRAADRLRIALDAGQAGVFETDFKARSFWCSPQFAEIMGRELTFEEASQRSWPMTHPDDVAEVARRIAESSAPGPGATTTRNFGMVQSRVILPSGQVRWVDTCAEVHWAEDGSAAKVVGLVLNIDQRKQQELALVEAQRAAEAAAEAKSQFLANMSHEIRTPMNGVMGVLHLLEKEPLSEDGQGLLQEAQACGQMLTQLLNDVIDFSKIEAGRMELASEALDPGALLQSVAGMLRPQAEAKGLELSVSVTGEPGWITADPVRLRQALFNLIGNAVKFTHEGGVEARLEVRDGESGYRRLRFEIQDTGVGIAEEAQGRLFQRFHQADGSTARRFGGSGLGLAITRSLADLMGGDVGFTSREGEGSTFWLEVDAPAADAPAAAQEAAADETPSAPLEGLRILVVEDNPTNRLVAGKILEGLGAAVASAEDGAQGVQAVAAERYDLVLMDIQMPEMDGVEATRRIRGLGGETAATPIIGLTANAMAHQRATYLEAGMDGVAAKPISPADLVAEIVSVLNRAADSAQAEVAKSA